jgi:cob(I)alamin adenosyltransferase
MAIKLTRIYTRTGDDGSTALVGGSRVSKTDPHVEAYGTVDELNSVLGILRTLVDQREDAGSRLVRASREDLYRLQNQLFDIGSILATPGGTRHEGMPQVGAEDIAWLEQRIDAMNAELKPLDSFVLPGGGMLNAHAHLARTVCRRLERVLWRTQESTHDVPAAVLTFANRLSDYLFVYARWAALCSSEQEYLWEHPLKARDR